MKLPNCFPEWAYRFAFSPTMYSRCFESSLELGIVRVFLGILKGTWWYLIAILICITNS